jgi:hypothetical protein
MAIWYILYANLVDFPLFGYAAPRKIWQTWMKFYRRYRAQFFCSRIPKLFAQPDHVTATDNKTESKK